MGRCLRLWALSLFLYAVMIYLIFTFVSLSIKWDQMMLPDVLLYAYYITWLWHHQRVPWHHGVFPTTACNIVLERKGTDDSPQRKIWGHWSQFWSQVYYIAIINSLAPGRFQWHFRWVIFMLILVIDDWSLVKLASDECNWILLTISQHWFR